MRNTRLKHGYDWQALIVKMFETLIYLVVFIATEQGFLEDQSRKAKIKSIKKKSNFIKNWFRTTAAADA